jgi:hypothetical protein
MIPKCRAPTAVSNALHRTNKASGLVTRSTDMVIGIATCNIYAAFAALYRLLHDAHACSTYGQVLTDQPTHLPA